MKMMNDKITDEFALVAEIAMVAGQFGVAVGDRFYRAGSSSLPRLYHWTKRSRGLMI